MYTKMDCINCSEICYNAINQNGYGEYVLLGFVVGFITKDILEWFYDMPDILWSYFDDPQPKTIKEVLVETEEKESSSEEEEEEDTLEATFDKAEKLKICGSPQISVSISSKPLKVLALPIPRFRACPETLKVLSETEPRLGTSPESLKVECTEQLKTEEEKILAIGINASRNKTENNQSTKKNGGYASLSQVERGLSEKDQETLINFFNPLIVGKKLEEAYEIVRSKGYDIHVLYVNNGSKKNGSTHDPTVLGVKIKDTKYSYPKNEPSDEATVFRIVDIGGVDFQGKGLTLDNLHTSFSETDSYMRSNGFYTWSGFSRNDLYHG